MKKFFAAVLTVFLSLGLLTACEGGQQHGSSFAPAVHSVESSDTGSADISKSRIRQNKIYTDSESISQNGEQSDAKSPGSAEIHVEPDQAYTDKDHVAAYIRIYRKLPPNYITKAEARSLGWKDKGTLDQVAPGKSIGGDRFSNYEKILPDAPGRSWKECDIDYVRGNRNAKRICFSNDGLIYYTSSHYQDFEKIY